MAKTSVTWVMRAIPARNSADNSSNNNKNNNNNNNKTNFVIYFYNF